MQREWLREEKKKRREQRQELVIIASSLDGTFIANSYGILV